VAEGSSLRKFHAISLGKYLPTVTRMVLPSPSGSRSPTLDCPEAKNTATLQVAGNHLPSDTTQCTKRLSLLTVYFDLLANIVTGVCIVQTYMHMYEYVSEFVSVFLYLFHVPELVHFSHESLLQHI
jgi:hypothetical protein